MDHHLVISIMEGAGVSPVHHRVFCRLMCRFFGLREGTDACRANPHRHTATSPLLKLVLSLRQQLQPFHPPAICLCRPSAGRRDCISHQALEEDVRSIWVTLVRETGEKTQK